MKTEKDYFLILRIGFHVLIISLVPNLPVFFISDTLDVANRNVFISQFLFSNNVGVPLYILNIVYLIPEFLSKGRYKTYILLLLAGILVSWFIAHMLMDAFLPVGTLSDQLPFPFKRPIFFPAFMILAIGICFEVIVNWERQRRENEHNEKEKIFLELSYLKSQINPHFLFNALNNIHSLSEIGSSKTSDAILILSDLLRYMLYGSNHGKVALAKEIECIENYIVIQKLRIPQKNDIQISFTTQDTATHNNASHANTVYTKTRHNMIEPLVLLPFVENAFKHGISYNQKSQVLISLQVEEDILYFSVYNTKRQDQTLKLEEGNSGIGLSNTRRRLELLYPNKHLLEIENGIDSFEIKLRLELV